MRRGVKKKVAIMGASGYSGFELVRLLTRHPLVELVACGAHSEKGKSLRQLDPRLPELELLTTEQILNLNLDVCFTALPHGVSQETVAHCLDRGFLTIDLSADFRIKSAALYEQVYGIPHLYPDLLAQAVYGLSEWYGDEIAGAGLIANPGCYPTSILLALAPLARAGLLMDAAIICDSKSGVSGAGRAAKLGSLFCEAAENLSPYQVGNVHRHTCEISQELQALKGDRGRAGLVFTPHLLPLGRGMLSTIYLRWAEVDFEMKAVRRLLDQAYQSTPLVHVLPDGETATIRHTQRTQRCAISLHPIPTENTLVVISSIDNLGKGAAGQAVQNMNLALGWPQESGLL